VSRILTGVEFLIQKKCRGRMPPHTCIFILYKIQDQEKKDAPDFTKNTSALAIMADHYKRRPNIIKLRKVKVLIKGSGEGKAVNLIPGKTYPK